jgi:hypothetical protein
MRASVEKKIAAQIGETIDPAVNSDDVRSNAPAHPSNETKNPAHNPMFNRSTALLCPPGKMFMARVVSRIIQVSKALLGLSTAFSLRRRMHGSNQRLGMS